MPERTFAVVGLFENADALLRAVPSVRECGLGRVEAYTPYPIHGLASALRLRRSPLGGMVLVMGILGALTAILFEWWANGIDYPTITGGKALFSWEAFVPIMFELTVAFATFTAGFGMLVLLNRLPLFAHPLLASQAMAAITRDRLALAIEADKEIELDAEAARAALVAAGAGAIDVVAYPAPPPQTTARTLLRLCAGIAAACLVSGQLMYWSVKLFPVLLPMVRMLDQPRLSAQRASSFFADGRVDRLPAPGTVARGFLPYDISSPEEANRLANPLPRSSEVMAEGRRAYETYCVVCHGPLATGDPLLSKAYGAKPANMQSPAIRAYPDGHYYDVIMRGKNAMPSYAADLSEDERWAVVHYLRALQRAQNATEEDLR
jgi:mono/diheme cytochrome c family protein